MKTNTLWLLAAALVIPATGLAQQDADPYTPTSEQEKALFETVTKIQKKTDKFNLYFNMHGDFDASWTGGDFDQGKFQMSQFRIEAKGDINDWLSYRYRQRLTKSQQPAPEDNLAYAIDIAGIGLHGGKWSAFLGKQCASYGGIEFDLNPIEIYQYSDMVDYMSNFMTGVNVAYNFTPRQQLQFQVLDALNESSEEKYGNYEKSKLPLVYTLNWNGNFCDVFKTRWSASAMSEVKGRQMYYFALGNEFVISPKVGAYFDWMYSREGVDRKGIMTSIVGSLDPTKMTASAEYMSFVLHLNYRFTPKWNVFFKGMYETAGLYKARVVDDEGISFNLEKGRYRTAWGYIAGIEYYPMADSNLHFFATYIGRSYRYNDRAKAFGESNYNTSRLSVGFIWQMPVF